jgi:hypothetical protein
MNDFELLRVIEYLERTLEEDPVGISSCIYVKSPLRGDLAAISTRSRPLDTPWIVHISLTCKFAWNGCSRCRGTAAHDLRIARPRCFDDETVSGV